MDVLITPSRVEGRIKIPASKSLSHRALICAGLAQGTSTIYNLGTSQDIEATMECLKALGATFSKEDQALGLLNAWQVKGCNPALRQSPVTLNANESGSTLRFFIPIAATSAASTTFLGKPSLLTRPLGIYENIFIEQGLPFEQGPQGLHFHGPLASGLYTLNGNISSQFISGLLLAGPLLEGMEIAVLPPYQSKSYVDLTIDMMKTFGVSIEQPTEQAYFIAPQACYHPATVMVESDWSQAAFFLALGLLNAPIQLEGLVMDSKQGDAVIASIIQQAGGQLKVSQNQGMTTVSISPHQRLAFEADLANCPDLGPMLCALAAFLPGQSTLTNAARLRFKECDRIAAMEDELKKWGVSISSDENTIYISGKETYKSAQPVILDGHNDHRVVMAMSIFGLCAQSPSIIQGAEAIAKSYPTFFEDLKALGANIQQIA